jgi:hypothetical protein
LKSAAKSSHFILFNCIFLLNNSFFSIQIQS